MKICEECRSPLVPNVGTKLDRPDVVLLWWSCAVCDYALDAEEWPRVLLSSALGTLPLVMHDGTLGLHTPGVAASPADDVLR